MKAWVLEHNEVLEYKEVEIPIISETEVLVKVKASGICGSDISRIYKNGAHKTPLIPGHEFSGQVIEVGSNVDKKWKGKRVAIFPLIPCKKCKQCLDKKFEMCSKYNYLGSRTNGGFAEYVAVPEWNLIELPQDVSYEEAALLEPLSVAIHAVRKIEPNEKDNVVICGLGTIGILLAMVLKEKGQKNIYFIGNKEYQKNKLESIGFSAENFCDCSNQDVYSWMSEKMQDNKVNVYFECVGNQQAFIQGINLAAPGGKICLIGNPDSDKIELDKQTYWKLLRNQLTIIGSWNSSFLHEVEDDWNYALNKIIKKVNLDLVITHKFKLEDVNIGLEIMKNKKENFTKIILLD